MRLFKKKLICLNGENNRLISPKTKNNRLYKRSPITVNGDNNIIKIGENNQICKLEIIIKGHNNRITIGDNLQGFLKLVIDACDTEVNIGKDCLFRGCEAALFESGSVLNFGDGSMSARDSRLYVSDFHTIYDTNTGKALNKGTHLNIGKHVWIGEGAMVLKNHTIADNTIIAAHSVVTRDLTESNAVYAGNPATLKKSGVNWNYDHYDEYVRRQQ